MDTPQGDLIVVRNDATLSGKFLTLDDTGRLKGVTGLIAQLTKDQAELRSVEDRLRSCNDQRALSVFAAECFGKRRNFSVELKKVVRRLETRKTELQSEIAHLKEQVNETELGGEFEIDRNAPFAGLTPRIVRREASPFVQYRNGLIRKNPDLSIKATCNMLDFELSDVRDHDVVSYRFLPASWTEKFGVRSFKQAYADPGCRPVVKKMISTERKGLQG